MVTPVYSTLRTWKRTVHYLEVYSILCIWKCSVHFSVYLVLEDTARYAGLLLAPAEGFGRGLFLPFEQKKSF